MACASRRSCSSGWATARCCEKRRSSSARASHLASRSHSSSGLMSQEAFSAASKAARHVAHAPGRNTTSLLAKAKVACPWRSARFDSVHACFGASHRSRAIASAGRCFRNAAIAVSMRPAARKSSREGATTTFDVDNCIPPRWPCVGQTISHEFASGGGLCELRWVASPLPNATTRLRRGTISSRTLGLAPRDLS